MKILKQLLVLISFFSITKTHSQNIDSNIVFFSKAENIYYKTYGQFSSINIVALKFANEIAGIQFVITTTKINEPISIKTDSILLRSGEKTLTLNKIYADTIYWEKEGNLLLSSILLLNQKGIDFLKSDPVTGIIFIVNTQPMLINIAKKSQKKIKTFANDNY